MTLFPLRRGPLSAARDVMHGWRVTSTFGSRLHPVTGRPSNHRGMDLAWYGCTGEPILAPVAGTATQGWDPSGGGNWTTLVADDNTTWGFGHARRFLLPTSRCRVAAGQALAEVGSTGGSTGPHLHVSLRQTPWGPQIDPWDLLAAADAVVPDTIAAASEAATMNETAVRRILDAALVDLRRDLNEQTYIVVDGRPGQLSGWLLFLSSGRKRHVPSTEYLELLQAAVKDGHLPEVRDLGLRGAGDPYIALLDLAEQF